MNVPEPLIGCVILNFGRLDDTLECLRSLAAGSYRRYFAIVLDCLPAEGGSAAICASFPDAEVIALHENRGYAGNNNIGIRAALRRSAEWVFLLNDDTVLDTEVLAQLVGAIPEGNVGVAGPLLLHHSEPDVIQSAGGAFTADWQAYHFGLNEPDRHQFREVHEVQWVSGCAILVRREVIRQVGELDERFFTYWEETELCLRARKAGWRVLHVPSARVWHKGVQREYRPRPEVTYYITRNHLLTMAKHAAPRKARLRVWLGLLRTLLSWTIRPKWRAKRAHRDAMWRAIVDYRNNVWGPMPG
jgi:GT2 family glycosyltransferase